MNADVGLWKLRFCPPKHTEHAENHFTASVRLKGALVPLPFSTVFAWQECAQRNANTDKTDDADIYRYLWFFKTENFSLILHRLRRCFCRMDSDREGLNSTTKNRVAVTSIPNSEPSVYFEFTRIVVAIPQFFPLRPLRTPRFPKCHNFRSMTPAHKGPGLQR